MQAAFNHDLPQRARDEIAGLACAETDRYVAGMLFEVLARSSADAAVIRALAARRWNPVQEDAIAGDLWGQSRSEA